MKRSRSSYRSVQQRAEQIDNAEARQKVIVELYEKFFSNAFPKMADRLGIVYTPTEVVDYLLHSADHVLREHFGKGLSDEGVHVLDPFHRYGDVHHAVVAERPDSTGGCSAEVRWRAACERDSAPSPTTSLPSISSRCFQEAFGGEYRPFTGIVWTDTFQMTENEQVQETDDGAQFKIMEFSGSVNSERVRQEQVHTVFASSSGNPPYSAGQTSANDNNQNLRYARLTDQKIARTYAARSTGQNLNSLYDSYIRAIRWSSDRIGNSWSRPRFSSPNAGFIDGNAMDGVRATLADEFSSIWVFNARGNQRTSGELSRKEGGNIFRLR